MDNTKYLSTKGDFINYCKDKKVLILDTFMWTPHFETSMEIFDSLEHANIEVTHELFLFNAKIEDRWDLKRKIYRYISIKPLIYIFRYMKRFGIRQSILSIFVQLIALIRSSKYIYCMNKDEIDDAIFSSALSYFKTSEINKLEFFKYKKKMISSLHRVYAWSNEIIMRKNPDIIVIFNGRFATSRLLRRMAEYSKCEYIIHERGSSKDKYSLWLNGIPHNPRLVNLACHELISNNVIKDDEIQKIGANFFKQRRLGNNLGWHSFMHDYDSPELKKIAQKRNDSKLVVFFTSSEDEFQALRRDLPVLGDLGEQLDAITAAEELSNKLGYKFILRLHPSLSSRPLTERNKYPKGKYVIEPYDTVSSYGLIKEADYVITHNSQIALESAALGCPAAYTGRSRFEDLSCVEKCFSKINLKSFLRSNFDSNLLIREANKAGYYLALFGISYENYYAINLSNGTYKNINMNLPWSMLNKFKV